MSFCGGPGSRTGSPSNSGVGRYLPPTNSTVWGSRRLRMGAPGLAPQGANQSKHAGSPAVRITRVPPSTARSGAVDGGGAGWGLADPEHAGPVKASHTTATAILRFADMAAPPGVFGANVQRGGEGDQPGGRVGASW